MQFDVQSNLAATDRSVSSPERDGQPARAVTLSRAYATTVDDLWDAVTSADRIPRYFAPVTGDLELGGRYQIEGNAGGTVTECEPPSRFALTWEFGGDTSWVEVRVSGEGRRPRALTLTHTALLSEHWDTFGPGAVGVGWEMGLLGLALHLANPDEPRPDEEEFAASPDGRAFTIGSSDGWGRAATQRRRRPRHRRRGRQAHRRLLHRPARRFRIAPSPHAIPSGAQRSRGI